MAEDKAKSETAKREEGVMEFWRADGTFQKSLEKPSPKGEFVFYDGPPFATGLPHMGHLLASTIKDVVGRYKTMRGYHVRRRWGWDMHGLPIESLVEKKLGLKTKKDILEIGVEKFNAMAREMVTGFERDWEKYVERIGRWVDFSNSYKTMDNTYIESVWWALKQLWDKNLLYEGNKVLMYCPHCETPLAKAEIAMDNTYKDITEEAVTVRFKVKNPAAHGLPENTYLLAWTTTPWTLPGNVALAVGKDIAYVISKKGGEHLITAEALAPKDAETVGKKTGAELVGLEYEPLFDVPKMKGDTSYKVYAADFVSTNEGTGIVHTAVMYGEDDYALGQKEKLPMVQMLNANGTYNDSVPEFLRGKYIKDAEKDIKKDLETRGLLFERKNNTHSYPHCYRCGTPLIYNAVASWFIKIQDVKDRMISENKDIQWVPEHLRDGRFGNIVENAPDWTISRNRFWASPLPIWKSKEGKVMVVGSLDEIKQKVKKSGNTYFVMRHAEAHSNAENWINSDNAKENPLTEKGKEQARAAAEKMEKPDVIVTSPIARAKETAEIIREHFGLTADALVEDARMREIDLGRFNNGPRDAFLKAFPTFESRFESSEAESWAAIRRRVGACLYELERAHAGKRVLIVTHDTPGFLLETAAQGLTFAEALARRPAHEDMHFELAEARPLDFVPIPVNADYELDLHRPYTDSLVLVSDGQEYARIPEVVDCWVESGSMPFAELHYPFANREEYEKTAPGDFITEYIAQTRTWFYYMHAMGVLLFGRKAFKAVVTTGTVLAADGEKMSKSKGNYTDPLENVDRYGADALRLYFLGHVIMQAEDMRFKDDELRDVHNRTIGILWNTFKFFDLYRQEYDGKTDARKSAHVLDRWILARLDGVVADVTKAMDSYHTPEAVRPLRQFVDDYSTWYVRRSRERMKGEGEDRQYALATQREVLHTLAKLLAPIAPFIAESIWRGAGEEGSVHLQEWPAAAAERNEQALGEMAKVRALVSKALEARDKAGIKVRQPLRKLEVGVGEWEVSAELLDVIKDEVNVKEVAANAGLPEGEVRLDTELTPELKEEGVVRETLRLVQDARKKAGLNPGERGSVSIVVPAGDRAIIEKHLAAIAEQTNTDVAFS